MRTPASLEALVDYGIIEEVVRPLMSGKEAQVYVVVAGGEECVAKVYKEATQRTFKHRAEYTEGRRTRNSRDQRAVTKRTRHGRKQDESAWRNAEVDVIHRLREAAVRVPEPLNFFEGVLVMELVRDAEGDPAPRLGDLSFPPSEAREIYDTLIQQVVRMLCAGVVHGDLSDFNVLMGADGPVLIDFPQAVDPARNQSARRLLLRDVENLHRFLLRFSPGLRVPGYAQEMWALYETNQLQPETALLGDYRAPKGKANTAEVMALVDEAKREEQFRRDLRGDDAPVDAPRALRTVVDFTAEKRPKRSGGARATEGRGARPERPRTRAADKSAKAVAPHVEGAAEPRKRRGRRRRKTGGAARGDDAAGVSRGEPTTAEKTPPGAGKAKASRRRRPRGGSRTRSGEAADPCANGATRPSRPAADAKRTREAMGTREAPGTRESTGSATSADGDRPARRKRRRPRRRSPDTSDR